MDPLFEVMTFETPAGVVLRLVGELDMSTISLMQEAADTLIRDERAEITVDLREITFMDSSGLHALLALRGYAQANDANLTLVPAPDPVMLIVRIAGVEDSFQYVEEPPRPAMAEPTGSSAR
jgi:anti-sigma B factor antagonist